MDRHDITADSLSKLVKSFSRVNVLTIGDIIIDDYINCEPLGVSQEDPTLVVTPVAKTDLWVPESWQPTSTVWG